MKTVKLNDDTHAERRDGLKECCATCRSHMGDMCEKGHWSECNDKDFFKWMDEKIMKCDDYKSKEVETKDAQTDSINGVNNASSTS